MMNHIGLASIASLVAAPFAYVPDMRPVGHASTYFPRDVTEDMKALNFLGFLPDAVTPTLTSTGTQAGDIAQHAGGFDDVFRGAVGRFQTAAGITADTWIGPQTRTALVAAVARHNLDPQPPRVLPPSVPVNPGGVPAQPAVIPGVHPASAHDADDTLMYVGIGAGVLALGGLAWYALK